MVKIIMAVARVPDKGLLFGHYEGRLPWGHCREDMMLFKTLTSDIEHTVYVCSNSTYQTLPIVAVQRLNPVVMEEFDPLLVRVKCNVVVLGGRKLIEEAIPYADAIHISEIGGVGEHKEGYIYLRPSTEKALSDFERYSRCEYSLAPISPFYNEPKPFLKQAYTLFRD